MKEVNNWSSLSNQLQGMKKEPQAHRSQLYPYIALVLAVGEGGRRTWLSLTFKTSSLLASW
ncbi:hypothetical protein FOMPIDRAFT_122945 [Fomitopsis schrenkii]|uniref:Uncharacterized protein n=1 Tax=Fomitopsis schrenkii TaxID=2126942 RepID=S8E849_FOMSC|nr:hypothetical protein FOMPIDRAFT_122945 [Fomitopsis schrenkii]